VTGIENTSMGLIKYVAQKKALFNEQLVKCKIMRLRKWKEWTDAACLPADSTKSVCCRHSPRHVQR